MQRSNTRKRVSFHMDGKHLQNFPKTAHPQKFPKTFLKTFRTKFLRTSFLQNTSGRLLLDIAPITKIIRGLVIKSTIEYLDFLLG